MDPKKLYKRYIPEQQHFHDHHYFRHFGNLLHDPNLWHLNRRSAANAVAAGLFIAFIPVPGQTIIAALVAILARFNLPLTVTSVFLTNPITMGPLFLLAYKIGAVVMGMNVSNAHFEFSYQWFSDTLFHIWKPLLTGCFILGVFSAAMGKLLIRLFWRLHLVRRWKKRRLFHRKR